MRQNKAKGKTTAKMAINELRKSRHVQTDDTETVNYNNDINLDDVDSDVKFIKQVPVHPRDRLAQNSKKSSKEIKKDDEVEFIKQTPVHQRERLARKIKQHPKNKKETDKIHIVMPTGTLLAKTKNRRKYTKGQKQTITEKLLKQNDVTAKKVRKTKNPKKGECWNFGGVIILKRNL